MIKRLTAILLCVLMLLSAGSLTALARAETVEFGLSVTEGKTGDTVTLSIGLSEQSYFTNATLYVHYDPAVVSYVADSEATGAASPKMNTMFAVVDHPDKEYVKGVYVTVNGITKSGVLMMLDFEVKSDDPAVFSLSFEECCGSDENIGDFDVEYVTFGCVLNNSTVPDTSVTAPVITPTTPSGGSEAGITTQYPIETLTTTTKAPGDDTDPEQGDSGEETDEPAGDVTTAPNAENVNDTVTTVPSNTDKDTVPTTTAGKSTDVLSEEPAPSNVGTIVAIVVLVLALAGGITAFAVIAARKAKENT